MFKTTVKYKDFNDKPHVEDLYFHMMAPEFADLQFNTSFDSHGGMSDFIRHAMQAGDGQKIYTFFKLMIVNSYGRRSEDGSEFVKSPAFTEKFLNSRAYEEFFMWLITDPQNAEKYWNGIIPEKLAEQAAQIQDANAGKKALTDMTREELVELMAQKLAEKTPANEVAA